MAAHSPDHPVNGEGRDFADRDIRKALLGIDPRLTRAPIGETPEQRQRRRATFRERLAALGFAGQASASVDASGFPVIETTKGPLCIGPFVDAGTAG